MIYLLIYFIIAFVIYFYLFKKYDKDYKELGVADPVYFIKALFWLPYIPIYLFWKLLDKGYNKYFNKEKK